MDHSSTQYTYSVFTWGDYLTYVASDQYIMAPWTLVLYRISTAEVTILAENVGGFPVGWIHENLVALTTTKYCGGLQSRPADIEMYDINSAVFRRVTTRESNLRAAGIFFPYLLIVDVLGQQRNQNDYYVANLVELGITDGQGNLIPGDGVIDPP